MGITAEEHLVYYVSDTMARSSSGHCRKMDAGREIAGYICREMHNAGPMKYTEYNREKISSRSVGIIFPAYIWGCSLAVYSFLQQLRGRIGENTYVYAVAVGENLSGSVLETVHRRIYSLGEFRRIFVKCGLGTEADIYVRCIDAAGSAAGAITAGRGGTRDMENLRSILSALLFCDMKTLSVSSRSSVMQSVGVSDAALSEEADLSQEEILVAESNTSSVFASRKRRLENVFLDESMLSGVRMCRVM